MSKSKPKAPPARGAVGHNSKRPIDVIGADLRKRTDMFEVGELLTKAKRLLLHGE
jgi:hypothetical protein